MLAIKLENFEEEGSMLEREIKVLIEVKKKQGFPSIRFYGQEKGYIYCIMTCLGKNMESMARKCGGVLSMGTVLKVGIQVLNRIESFHQTRFIHRDIKPDNFVLGTGNQVSVVHLIDFGLSKYFVVSALGGKFGRTRRASTSRT